MVWSECMGTVTQYPIKRCFCLVLVPYLHHVPSAFWIVSDAFFLCALSPCSLSLVAARVCICIGTVSWCLTALALLSSCNLLGSVPHSGIFFKKKNSKLYGDLLLAFWTSCQVGGLEDASPPLSVPGSTSGSLALPNFLCPCAYIGKASFHLAEKMIKKGLRN